MAVFAPLLLMVSEVVALPVVLPLTTQGNSLLAVFNIN